MSPIHNNHIVCHLTNQLPQLNLLAHTPQFIHFCIARFLLHSQKRPMEKKRNTKP